MEITVMHDFALKIIQEAGERIRQSFSEKLEIETKANANDLVTNIDRETELFFIEQIKSYDPSFKILGEEGMGEPLDSLEGVVWIIDPIDGTMNFIRQHCNFAISVGIYVNGIGKLGYIYDVMRNDLYYAIQGQGAYLNERKLEHLRPLPLHEAIIGVNATWATPNRYIEHEKMIDLVHFVRGTRSYGSATLEIAAVACGRMDAYMSMRLSPWDIAGGAVIASEVGAIVSNLKNEAVNLEKQDTFIIANPEIHKTIIEQYINLK
ncbi:inositol monophosphatase family protein [Viridibacillus sp. YIM B01967]|uniref:inositol-phosphate phosphatase n=1 Tax=Viridibacillus soli TaxID=2798301 RepID=A0ABS1H7L4_9BACL|nr:inositol monophosphatase family protein [Viridibacillus soli]MBK3495414.1 inositol monophosphatase family protein [Viridibacillus soli]